MLDKAINHFMGLGLKEADAQVYLACLSHPAGLFVHEIARQTEIKRSTIDVILVRLRKQGFISRHKEGARWVYCAEPPDKLAFSFEQKLQNFEDFLPVLLSSLQGGKMPVIRFFEGAAGIEHIYDDILLSCQKLPPEKSETLAISSGSELIKLIPDHMKRFIQKRVRRRIPVRLISPDNEVTRRIYAGSETYLRTTKFFNEKKYPFQIEVNIYTDKVAFVNFVRPGAVGLIIQSKPIAESMRSLFNFVWNLEVLTD